MFLLSADFFLKNNIFEKNSFRSTIRMSYSFDGPDLGPNCLPRLSADDTSVLVDKEFITGNLVCQSLKIAQNKSIMHQSFLSTAPGGRGLAGPFNCSIFKAPLQSHALRAKIVVKSLLKAPALPGAYNDEEKQMT